MTQDDDFDPISDVWASVAYCYSVIRERKRNGGPGWIPKVIKGCNCEICTKQREAPLEKRTWCYVMPPSAYEIAPCSCGNADTQWSEFKHHLWCDKCQKDFIPDHGGIFEGPIAVEVCKMLGISFDRINLETNGIEPFEPPFQMKQK